MFDRLMKLIHAPEPPDALAEDDGRLALAAVLVEAARADGDYAEVEADRIARVLARSFALSPFEAVDLRREAEQVQEQAADLVRFTRVLKTAVPERERIGILEAVWEVVLADGQRDDEETGLVRKLAGLLYVTDVDAGIARRRAVERMEGGGTG